jgi:hypothetical protein
MLVSMELLNYASTNSYVVLILPALLNKEGSTALALHRESAKPNPMQYTKLKSE